ncbi:MAG: HEAT repeat domain-containing protein, partial [Anaerolineae bacterium]
ISRQTLAMLSGPSRAEGEQFGAWLSGVALLRRREIMVRMVELVHDSFEIDYVALFRQALADGDPEVRRLAVEGLWEDECVDLIEPLRNLMLQDPDTGVRAAAAGALGRFVLMGEFEELDARRASSIRRSLEEVVRNPSEALDVVRRAIESIAYINDDIIRSIIERAYAHDDDRLRESAVFAMGRNADTCWSDTVLGELEGGSSAMRLEAARACGELQLEQAVSQLIKMAEEEEPQIQGMAIWTLGQIGGKRARVALTTWADSDDDRVRIAATEALEEIDLLSAPMDLFVQDPEKMAFREVDLAEDGEGDLEDQEVFADDSLVLEGFADEGLADEGLADEGDDLDEGDEEWVDEPFDLI